MGYPIENFLLLVLEVSFELSPIGIHKGLRVTQASLKECLELVLHNRGRGLGVMSPLVLLPAEADLIPQERLGKENPGRSYSSSSSKIVLLLLTEVVAVHVRFSAVYVRGTGLQLLPGCLDNNGSWSKNGNKSKNGSGRRNGSGSGNGSESGNES